MEIAEEPMKSTFKRNFSAVVVGFVFFFCVSVFIYFDDATSVDTRVQFLTVSIGLSLLFGLAIPFLLAKRR